MTMTIKTESGSVYFFTQKEGRVFFQRGTMTGEVIRIKNGCITTGKAIEMDFRKDGLYGAPDESIMYLRTTPVAKMTVTL